MSHTPGPWGLLCSESRGGPRCLVVCPKDNEIASINPFRESWNEDAELIAAAPDLLQALKRTSEILFAEHGPKIYRANFMFIEEAIKKARGEA